jgi:hypothetical protein
VDAGDDVGSARWREANDDRAVLTREQCQLGGLHRGPRGGDPEGLEGEGVDHETVVADGQLLLDRLTGQDGLRGREMCR